MVGRIGTRRGGGVGREATVTTNKPNKRGKHGVRGGAGKGSQGPREAEERGQCGIEAGRDAQCFQLPPAAATHGPANTPSPPPPPPPPPPIFKKVPHVDTAVQHLTRAFHRPIPD